MRYNHAAIFDYISYYQYLGSELEARKRRNPAYSLRSMAAQLGLSPSTLSDVINNKKNLSERTARVVAEKLSLSGRKAKYFQTLVHFESTKDESLKQILLAQLRILNPKLREHFEVRTNQFNVIAEWHHAAILEMTYLHDTKITPETISAKLGITEAQSREALELLLKLGLLSAGGPADYKKTQSQVVFQSEVANHALRRFHHDMLAKAQECLHQQTNKNKFVGSETFPLNVTDLQEAKDIIEACFQQLLELSKRSQDKSHVYHCGIQMFQLTQGQAGE